MNTLKSNLFALLVLIVAITGCKKDSETLIKESINPEIQLKSANSGIQLKNGYLSFKDSLTFIEHLNWIRQNEINPEIINKFNMELGFESFSEVYDKGMSMTDTAEFEEYRKNNPDCFKKIILEDNSVFWEMPMTSLLSYMTDKHGVCQIFGTIHRITEEYSFSTDNEEKLPVIVKTSLAINDNEIIKVANEMANIKSSNEYSYRTDYFSGWNDRRIVARLYRSVTSHWPAQYSHDARVTSQKRGWTGIWAKAEIDDLRLTWKRGYYVTANGSQLSPEVVIPAQGFRKTNASDFRLTIIGGVFYPIQHNYSSCLVTHTGIRYGNIATITDNELFPNLN